MTPRDALDQPMTTAGKQAAVDVLSVLAPTDPPAPDPAPLDASASHVWERFDTILHRCIKCGWGWKVGADNDFPCPGKPSAPDPAPLDEERLARVLTALDVADMDSQQNGYSNMEWRSWPTDAIAAAIAAEYAALASEGRP